MKSNNHELTYFKIDQRWYGEKIKITVNFITGNYTEETFYYDHDFVYDKVLSHLETLNCWADYSCYSNTRNIPGFAELYVTEK
jgi:hypothetical protein